MTVRSSGTHVLRNQVLRLYEQWNQPGGDRVLDFFHVAEMHIGEKRMAQAKYRFSSLRHPRRIAESWRRRADDGSLARRRDNLMIELGNMILYHPWVTMYLHVDQPAVRGLQAWRIRELVGLDDLKPYDFSVGKDSGAMKGTHNIPVEECPEVPQRYIDFYEMTLEAAL